MILIIITPDRQQSKMLILLMNIDQKLFETEFLIAICRLTGDKWQSKTLFLAIFHSGSSIVKSIWATTRDFQQCGMWDEQRLRPACTVWSEPLLVAWILYDSYATDWTSFGVSKLKRRLHRLIWVYTCENNTLLEITCHGSFFIVYSPFFSEVWSEMYSWATVSLISSIKKNKER